MLVGGARAPWPSSLSRTQFPGAIELPFPLPPLNRRKRKGLPIALRTPGDFYRPKRVGDYSIIFQQGP